MIQITDQKIKEYILNLMPERDEILREMENYALENRFPIIGPMCGTFLRQIARIMNARSVFEMGSGYGYSACWFAGGMSKDGKIICTEGSVENKKRAMEYLRRGGYDSMVEFHVGRAQDFLKQYDGPFDIIFNDVDKEHYP
ncbi:MAG: class I SAM-dependent methyltransferase, partial [Candidatus Zixiibacteriota bacterium]